MTIAIIGGGAAGYFAAIEAKRNCPSADITIFEKAPKMLAKVEITGGGRCTCVLPTAWNATSTA